MSDTMSVQPSIGSICLLWLAAIWLLWLPGLLLTHLLRLSWRDILTQFALQIGLGLAFWPVFLLWTSMLGWRWSARTAQLNLLLFSIVGLLVLIRIFLNRRPLNLAYLRRSAGWLILFGIVAGLTIFTRLSHIRNLVLPLWVDSVSHTMLVRVFLIQGAWSETLAPFLPSVRFTYHWGYHAITAWLAWLLGWTEPLSVAQLVLQFGQVLNALTVLMLYAAGRVLFNSRRAGLLAAVLATLISWYPAYYVTWGRYTQLTGMLVLPIFGIALWQLRRRPSWGIWFAVVLLGAGLLLIHVRVAFYALTLAITLTIWPFVRRDWRTLGRWISAGIGVVLLSLPWLLVLIEKTSPQQILGAESLIPSKIKQTTELYNSFPWGPLWVSHNAELIALATGGISGLLGWGYMPLWKKVASGVWLCLLISLLVWSVRRHYLRRTRFSLTIIWRGLSLLLGWCVLTIFILSFDRFNTVGGGMWMWAISGIIAFFMPLSLAGGGLLAWASGQLTPHRWVRLTTASLILFVSVWGAIAMINIVESVTIIAKPADVQAMVWIRENTPPDAYFAINVRSWFDRTYVGTDGGYWISTLTDRRSIVPPTIGAPNNPQQLDALKQWRQTCSLNNPAARTTLRTAGVTHIYIGERGGHLCPEYLYNRPFVKLIYKDRWVNIFELKDE